MTSVENAHFCCAENEQRELMRQSMLEQNEQMASCEIKKNQGGVTVVIGSTEDGKRFAIAFDEENSGR